MKIRKFILWNSLFGNVGLHIDKSILSLNINYDELYKGNVVSIGIGTVIEEDLFEDMIIERSTIFTKVEKINPQFLYFILLYLKTTIKGGAKLGSPIFIKEL